MVKILKPLALILILIFAFGTTALAAEYEDVSAMVTDWAANGYPEYVSYVFSSSSEEDGSITVLLVLGHEDKYSTVMDLVEDTSKLSITSGGAYSMAELIEIQNDILSSPEFSEDENIIKCEVGWKLEDGNLVGFGNSGTEARVIVKIEEEHAQDYVEVFRTRYGDKVYIDSNITLEDLGVEYKFSPDWTFYVLIVVGLVFLVISFKLFARGRRSRKQSNLFGRMVGRYATLSSADIERLLMDITPVPYNNKPVTVWKDIDPEYYAANAPQEEEEEFKPKTPENWQDIDYYDIPENQPDISELIPEDEK